LAKRANDEEPGLLLGWALVIIYLVAMFVILAILGAGINWILGDE
jgi:hypothetical protein